MTVKDYTFFTKHHAYRTKYSNRACKLCRVVDPCKKVPDLNCGRGVQDLLLEVVDLK